MLAPVLLALIFFSIQASLFFYGRAVAIQAAREGVSQLRLVQTQEEYAAKRDAIESYAETFASRVGRQGLTSPEAEGEWRDQDGRVTMTVTGGVISLAGFELEVTATAAGSIERFQAP